VVVLGGGIQAGNNEQEEKGYCFFHTAVG
jgi:hypothetical protein